jgi:hypothetical protein
VGFFKQVGAIAQGFKPSNLKESLGGPTLDQMTPEQREAWLASLDPQTREKVLAGEAQAKANLAQADASVVQYRAEREATQVLAGPAGVFVYGTGPEDLPSEIRARQADQGLGAIFRDGAKEMVSGMGEAVRQELGGKVPELTDPTERARAADAERAARDAARAPYLAPEPPAIAFSRVATRGKTQVEDVLALLRQSGLADEPHRVYGVYRVPDRISPSLSLHSEKGRVVEWEVVHEPGAGGGATTAAIDDAWFPAREQWAARHRGEPSILDEDLGVTYCNQAGIAPEQCFGIARHSEFTHPANTDENDMSIVFTRVTGVHVFHAAGAGGDTRARMADAAPLAVNVEDVAGTHTEVLNALAIRKAIHVRPQDPVPVPSPFPYLPSSPQELLRMYLEVVGISAADCYGAQVTVHSYRELAGRVGFEGTTNHSPKQPCADGKERGRLHGAEHVVVTYRDRPAYAEGRTRWARYQEEVLQAHLERNTGARKAIPTDDHGLVTDSSLLRAGVALLEGIDRIAELGGAKPPPPFRYCWPPIP